MLELVFDEAEVETDFELDVDDWEEVDCNWEETAFCCSSILAVNSFFSFSKTFFSSFNFWFSSVIALFESVNSAICFSLF